MQTRIVLLTLIVAACLSVMNVSCHRYAPVNFNPNNRDVYCVEGECPKTPVTLEGTLDLTGSFAVNNKTIRVMLNASNLDILKYLEENRLLRGGNIRAKVTGIVRYQVQFMDGPTGVNFMIVEPKDVKFIETAGCGPLGPQHPVRSSPDCFNFSIYPMLPSEAYEKVMNSTFAKAHNLTMGSDAYYAHIAPATLPETNGAGWEFPCSIPQPLQGGCQTICYVNSERVALERRCSDDPSLDLELTERI
jgi:hypothetical protein